jgi:hypothetical protein
MLLNSYALMTMMFFLLVQWSMFPLFTILYMPVYSDLLVSSLVLFSSIKFLTFDYKKLKINKHSFCA